MLQLTNAQIRSLFDRGLRQMKAGNFLGAKSSFEKVILARPRIAEAHYNLGKCLSRLSRPLSAIRELEKARDLAPKETAITEELAAAYMRAGRFDAGLDAFDAVIRAQPKGLKPHMDKAVALQQIGHFDEAEAIFRKAYGATKLDPELYRIWLSNRRVTPQDKDIIKHALKLWEHPKLLRLGRVHLGFALAKAFADLGEHDRVFTYLRAANDAQAEEAPYDRSQRADRVLETQRIAAGASVERRGTSDKAPILIVGVPRSGTTLIEQILAAHPMVRSGGELGQARPMAYSTFGAPGQLPLLADVSVRDLDTYATRYWTAADETAQGDAPCVADKSMQHQLILGYMAAAFPQAKFLVVRRDPRDVALSIYKNHFAVGTHTYGNKLEDIAHELRTFEQSLSYWRDKVDMTEVDYDALTADPETQTRNLVAAAGLPWDDACLNHSQSKGMVMTLSIAQVRQPIYKSSSGGWRRYEAELAPFIEAWEAGA